MGVFGAIGSAASGGMNKMAGAALKKKPAAQTPMGQKAMGQSPMSGMMGKMGLGPSQPMNPSMGTAMGQMRPQPMNPSIMQPMNPGPQNSGMTPSPSGQAPGLFQQQYPQGSGLGPSFSPDDPRDPRRMRNTMY